MATTIGEATSRIRNVIKSVKEDPFITDRFLYSLIQKYSKLLIRRKEVADRLMMFHNLFETLPCIDLIEVDRIEACCSGIKTGCTFMRTKDKLPKFLENDNGPVIRDITSIDGSQALESTYPMLYTNMTKTSAWPYNKTKYYWFQDGYIYIPDVEWESIRIEAIFDEDISAYKCTDDSKNDCIQEQDREMSIPDYLFAEIEQMVIKEILIAGQSPSDGADDSQNALR
jgi:hypothetical protein